MLQASSKQSTCFIFQDSIKCKFGNIFQMLCLQKTGLLREVSWNRLETSGNTSVVSFTCLSSCKVKSGRFALALVPSVV